MTTGTALRPPGIWSAPLVWTTVGANALIFLAAFDALAVTTIMPAVARELDGVALYSAAFASTLAAQVIGTVVSGGWTDRRGPVAPLIGAVTVFVAGLVVAATASAMPVFVAGRFLQGLGMGAMIVAIYVIVARAYRSELHTRIFATFAAAWVVPGLVGPVAAGVVADSLGWPWVFAGVSVLVVVALAAITPTLRRILRAPSVATGEPRPMRRVIGEALLAVLLAVAVLGVGIAGELPAVSAWALAAVGVMAAGFLIRPLLPAGALRARRGLGSTILLRGTIAAAFFSTEVRLPYLLQERYGLESWQAGLILTVGALAWAGASAIQPRLAGRVSESRALGAGAMLVTAGIVLQFATAALTLHPAVAAGGWLVAAGGMGTIYPRLSTLMLGYSDPRDQGFNSSALSIIESVAGAVAIAVGGLVLVSAGGVTGPWGFAASILLSVVIAALAVPLALRVVHRDRDRT